MTFEEKIRALSLATPFSVTSWMRTASRNRKVGGAKNSMHLLGLAVDVVLDEASDLSLLKAMAKRLKLWVLVERDHVHLQEIIK